MTIPSAIVVGAPVGQGLVYYIDDNKKHATITIADLFREGVTAVFGGPAPFTRPEVDQAEQFENAYDELKSLGVNKVVAIYVQDAYVCHKFRELISSRTNSDNLRYYGDGDGFFVRAYDLWRDFTYQGLSIRSERWCAIIENNVVKYAAHDDYAVIDKTHVNLMIDWLKNNQN